MEQIIIKFVGKLITAVKLAASSIFGRLMAGAGMAFVAYNQVYPNIKDFVSSKFLALPGWAVQLLSYCAVDQAITMVISALVAYSLGRLTLVGATALEQQILNGSA